jgi:hypothetical protein
MFEIVKRNKKKEIRDFGLASTLGIGSLISYAFFLISTLRGKLAANLWKSIDAALKVCTAPIFCAQPLRVLTAVSPSLCAHFFTKFRADFTLFRDSLSPISTGLIISNNKLYIRFTTKKACA